MAKPTAKSRFRLWTEQRWRKRSYKLQLSLQWKTSNYWRSENARFPRHFRRTDIPLSNLNVTHFYLWMFNQVNWLFSTHLPNQFYHVRLLTFPVFKLQSGAKLEKLHETINCGKFYELLFSVQFSLTEKENRWKIHTLISLSKFNQKAHLLRPLRIVEPRTVQQISHLTRKKFSRAFYKEYNPPRVFISFLNFQAARKYYPTWIICNLSSYKINKMTQFKSWESKLLKNVRVGMGK